MTTRLLHFFIGTTAAIILLLSSLIAANAQITEGDDGPLRFARFEVNGEIKHGFLSVGGIHELNHGFFEPDLQPTGKVYPLKNIKLLAPVVPSKVIGIALNYKSHGGKKQAEPGFFSKLPSSIIGPDAKIVLPAGAANVHYEGELVIVMGARTKNVKAKDARDYIMGVTIGNDVTDRSIAFHPFEVIKSKGRDTFGPLGPWIVPGLSYDRLGWETRVNGKVVQKANSKQMIFSTGQIIEAVSKHITLEPGDVIYTGTAGKTRALKPGDVVEIAIEGIGTLKNTVAKPK